MPLKRCTASFVHRHAALPIRYIVLVALVVVCGSVSAIDRQVLADSLTQVVRQHAYTEGVKVTRIRVRNRDVSIYTNHTLSQVSLDESEVRSLRSLVSRLVLGHSQGRVSIYSDGYEIGELVTSRYRHRARSARYTLSTGSPWVSNKSRVYEVSKGLDGKHIALWGSHGRYYNQESATWLWQRAKVWTTVEDVYTSSYTSTFLVPMLENAGAVVVQPRERDWQSREQVVDETEARVVGDVVFRTGAGSGWGQPQEVLTEGQNPFEMGGYAEAKSALCSESELRYIPALPEGEYAVYVSYKTLPNSTDRACYTVVHKGQKTQYSVNQRMGGGTWVYLGTFVFGEDGDANYVALTNEDGFGQVVTADAVKFGGGMGSVARYPQPAPIGNVPSSRSWVRRVDEEVDSAALATNMLLATTSGMPRYLEGARYWMQYAGVPDSIYNYTYSHNDYIDDYASRGRWVNYVAGGSVSNPQEGGLGVPIHASLAFHTDAGVKMNDTIIGTLLIYTDHDDTGSKVFPTGKSRLLSRDLGDYVQTQIVEDMQCYTSYWMRRQLNNASYAESRHPKVPAILLELLSHQNYNDMRIGLDPRVKFAVSRAIYKGILRFMHEQYGTSYQVQPLPVRAMSMEMEGNRSRVSWQATPDTLEPTAQPSYYVVYTRQDDGDWDNGVRVSSAQYMLSMKQGVRYNVRVVAGNEGGVSMPSEVLSAYLSPEEKGRVLIVNGFDRVSGPDWFADSTYMGIRPQHHAVPYGRDFSYIGEQYEFDSRLPWVSDDNSGWGMCYSDKQCVTTLGNTFDYPCMHGKVLAEMGYSYVSSSAKGLDSIGNYDMVDVILGKQRTTVLGTDTSFHCMDAALQRALAGYLDRGGRLLLSGAYIASDMQGTEECAFVNKYLHYSFRSTHAAHEGRLRGLGELAGKEYTFYTEPNDRVLHTENPDGIIPVGAGAEYMARFADTGVGAGVGYAGDETGAGRTLCWSLMLESVHSFADIYTDCINWIMR